MKGKRTKRQRQLSLLALTTASISSSMTESGISENFSGGGFDHTPITTSNTNSSAITDSSVQEEEDMANCLILLAQGETPKTLEPILVPSSTYRCKTCDRCFPSFQALGGHRASHNKPNKSNIPNGQDNMPSMMLLKQDDCRDNTSTAVSLQITNSRVSSSTIIKSRVHECSICGAEFSSGQALGGHMRRHRTVSTATTTSTGDETKEVKKSRNMLALDLNLPAPEDEHRELEFVFASKKQVVVLSASSLVDCHH